MRGKQLSRELNIGQVAANGRGPLVTDKAMPLQREGHAVFTDLAIAQ